MMIKKKKKKKKTTISDIAHACGVSRWSVAAVLFPSEKNKHIGASAITRKKIHSAVKRLNYRANRASRNLRMNKHGSFGLLMRTAYSVPWVSMDAMVQRINRYDLLMVVERLPQDPDQLPTLLAENSVDGILTYENLGEKIDSAAQTADVPMVYVNANLYDKNRAWVTIDERGAMAMAVDLFRKKTKRKVLLLADGDNTFSTLREEGLVNACKKSRLLKPIVEVIQEEGDRNSLAYQERIEKIITGVLKKFTQIDAVISASDEFLLPLLRACGKLGKRIPQDISILNVRDNPICCVLDVRISAIYVDYSHMAKVAVDMLKGLVEQDDSTETNIMLPYLYVDRGSV